MKNTLRMLIALLLLVSTTSCVRRKKRAAEPAPQPVAAEPAPEPAAPSVQGIPSDPCDSEGRAHKWSFYPDEPLYYCDRHRHHWLPDGAGGWAHIHEYDKGRPNYAAPFLTNQSEWDIYLKYEQHSVEFPPGTRRQ